MIRFSPPTIPPPLPLGDVDGSCHPYARKYAQGGCRSPPHKRFLFRCRSPFVRLAITSRRFALGARDTFLVAETRRVSSSIVGMRGSTGIRPRSCIQRVPLPPLSRSKAVAPVSGVVRALLMRKPSSCFLVPFPRFYLRKTSQSRRMLEVLE